MTSQTPETIPAAEPVEQELPPSEVDSKPAAKLHLVPEDSRSEEAKKLAELPLVPVTGRPEGMTWEAYKQLQREQDKRLRLHKKGRVVHVSTQVLLVKDQAGVTQTSKKTGEPTRLVRKKTYKKPAK
jgi:hypothetical protein